MSHFLQLLSEKFIQMSKRDSLLEKLPVLAKSMIFDGFSGKEPLSVTFSEKFIEILKGDSLLEELPALAKSMIFHGFSRNEPLFSTSFPKISRKRRNVIVCLKGCQFWPNRWFFVVFHEMSHFLQLFSENFIQISKRHSLFEMFPVLAKSMRCRAFSRNEPLFEPFIRKVHPNLETW